MTRLLGYIGNQFDRARCAAQVESAALPRPRRRGRRVGRGHARRRRRAPAASPRQRGEQRGRAPRRGARRRRADPPARAWPTARSLENTQPFRFRQWLYADISPRDRPEARGLLGEVPGYLSGNVRGDTVSELRFHAAVSALFDEGRVDDPNIDRETVVAALRVAVARCDAAAKESAPLSLVLAWPQGLVAFCRGIGLSWVRRQGVRDCPACRKGDARVDHETLRYVMVADAPATERGWKEVGRGALPEAGQFLIVDRDLDVQELPA
ncbi:MAG: hypothetical protein R3A52_21525 [Polyangiales bacterium]